MFTFMKFIGYYHLKTNSSEEIVFQRNTKLVNEAHSDAKYVGSPIDRQFTASYCISLGGNLVTWRSKK